MENAVQTATALKEETAVPMGGEPEFEDVAVGFAIAAGVLVDFALEQAVRGEFGVGGD